MSTINNVTTTSAAPQNQDTKDKKPYTLNFVLDRFKQLVSQMQQLAHKVAQQVKDRHASLVEKGKKDDASFNASPPHDKLKL